MIKERFPVSIIFGVTGFLLTYLVCIPLGIAKALRHGSTFRCGLQRPRFHRLCHPAFAFGMVLKSLFAVRHPRFRARLVSRGGLPVSEHDQDFHVVGQSSRMSPTTCSCRCSAT
jgi:ABC-type microcin C transport system permease subunit YejB